MHLRLGDRAALRAARGGGGGGGAGDGASRVEHRGGSLCGSSADKGGGVREEQRETARGKSARIRRRGSVERREVEPHQRPREEEGGRHDFQETRENPVD